MKYAAINLGEKDLAYGREYLEKVRDEFALPFVSAMFIAMAATNFLRKPLSSNRWVT